MTGQILTTEGRGCSPTKFAIYSDFSGRHVLKLVVLHSRVIHVCASLYLTHAIHYLIRDVKSEFRRFRTHFKLAQCRAAVGFVVFTYHLTRTRRN